MSRWVWLVLFLAIAGYRVLSWRESGAGYDLVAAAGFVLLAVYSFYRPVALGPAAGERTMRPALPKSGFVALGIVAFGLVVGSFVWRLAAL